MKHTNKDLLASCALNCCRSRSCRVPRVPNCAQRRQARRALEDAASRRCTFAGLRQARTTLDRVTRRRWSLDWEGRRAASQPTRDARGRPDRMRTEWEPYETLIAFQSLFFAKPKVVHKSLDCVSEVRPEVIKGSPFVLLFRDARRQARARLILLAARRCPRNAPSSSKISSRLAILRSARHLHPRMPEDVRMEMKTSLYSTRAKKTWRSLIQVGR